MCDMKKETSLLLIAEWCALGSKIESDGWAAYRGISGIEESSFTHLVVNHSKNFKDSVNGTCTNTVEGKKISCSKFLLKTFPQPLFLLKTFPQPNRKLETFEEGGTSAMLQFF